MASAALLRPTRPAGCVKPRAEIYTRILRDLVKARRDVSPVNESKIARAVGSVREGWRLIESDGIRALLVPATEGAHGVIPKQCLLLPDATWAIPVEFGAGIRRMVAVTRRQPDTVAVSMTDARVWLTYAGRGGAWDDACQSAREWFPCPAIGGMPNLPVRVPLKQIAPYWDDRADLSLTWTEEVLQIDAAGAWRYVVMGLQP